MERRDPSPARVLRGAGWRLAALLPLALLLAGCGRGKGTVSGKVTLNGEPIPWGRITFLSQVGDKTPHSSRIVNGKYTINDCPAGPVKIAVESIEAKAVDTSKVPPKMLERSRQAGAVEPPAEVVGKHLPIPARYADPDKSGLDYTVESGSATHDIPLKPE
jgi:hypothetical protein